VNVLFEKTERSELIMTADVEVLAAAREVVSEITRRKLDDSAPILSSGIIDSLAILKLISSLERRLGIVIPTNQVQPDDFDSVELIVETIKRVAK
jgi:acyl carrier protein